MGLDIEADAALDQELVGMICREDEAANRVFVESRFGVDLPKLLFVVKEATFKLYNVLTRAFLEFKDVAVALDFEAGLFRARLAADDKPSCLGRRELIGSFGRGGGNLFAFVHLPAGPGASSARDTRAAG
jgi:4'-phosphopantetheinyl transferase EntD